MLTSFPPAENVNETPAVPKSRFTFEPKNRCSLFQTLKFVCSLFKVLGFVHKKLALERDPPHSSHLLEFILVFILAYQDPALVFVGSRQNVKYLYVDMQP